MPKQIKGTRKPPTPTDSHAEIAAWTGNVMPGLKAIVERLDAIIRKEIPVLQYALKWKRAFYGLPGKGWIIELAPYDVSANIVFHGGAKFESPPEQGQGSRYVKLRSLEEANAPEIRAWIREAARHPGWQ
jgi:hypothetical protein